MTSRGSIVSGTVKSDLSVGDTDITRRIQLPGDEFWTR